MSAFRTANGVIPKCQNDSIPPGCKRTISISFFRRNRSTDPLVGVSVSGIDAIIANHFEVFFRDMSHKAFSEFYGRNGFINKFVIFVTVVMEGNSTIDSIIIVDTGCSNDRTAKITPNVAQYLTILALMRFHINIEPFAGRIINLCFNFFECSRQSGLHEI